MSAIILLTVAAVMAGEQSSGKSDAQLLIDTVEALQQPVEDFRCEFEGKARFMGKVAQDMKVGGDGLFESFSGVFIWKRGAGIHSETLTRNASNGRIMRESLMVRVAQQQAEDYAQDFDATLGAAYIKSPKDINLEQRHSMTSIFLIDSLKRELSNENHVLSVSDDQIDGRPLKVLNVGLKGLTGSLIARYWIDLRRNGHVVRSEGYQPGRIMSGRLDVSLAQFKVGVTEVWMPVAGENRGYVALENKQVVVTKDPTSVMTIYVVGGTMELNRHPTDEAFTMKYKPGTPISDSLRKLEYEYGQQKIGVRPTKAAAEKMLKDQLAEAEEQKSKLVIAVATDGYEWSSWLTVGFGAAAAVASIALWLQRRGH